MPPQPERSSVAHSVLGTCRSRFMKADLRRGGMRMVRRVPVGWCEIRTSLLACFLFCFPSIHVTSLNALILCVGYMVTRRSADIGLWKQLRAANNFTILEHVHELAPGSCADQVCLTRQACSWHGCSSVERVEPTVSRAEVRLAEP